jgi:hypothetical protein
MTHSGILVINQNNEQLSPTLVRDLLENIECPVLIIK